MSGGTLRAEIIARDFNRMLEELAAIDPRTEFRDVVLGSAERVIRSAMRSTRAASAGRISDAFNEKEYTTFGGRRYKLANRYPDPLWRQIQAHRRERLYVKLEARGLSKKSWLHVAASIGRPIVAPGYVTAANYKGREYPRNGQSVEAGAGGNYALTILNSSPIVQAAGGYGALLKAMRGETRYFQMNMEKRAFSTFESRAKKYPQIFLRTS